MKVHPDNVRARYNLIYTLARRHDYATALKMVAEGLSLDKSGEFRDRFLQRQSEILNCLTHRRQQETLFRANRFLIAPASP